MAEVIIVTGSVGSGKTTISKALAKKLKFTYLDVNTLISKNPSVVSGYDKKRETKEIDTDKLNAVLLKIINKGKNLVIDSHLSHYLPAKQVDLCIVCTCDLSILKKRLEKRKYSPLKIKENLEADAFDICLVEAVEAGHNVEVIHTDKDVKEQLEALSQFIQRKRTRRS